MPEPHRYLPNGKAGMLVLQFVLGTALAIVSGYGAARYRSGEDAAKMVELERRIKDNEEALQKVMSRADENRRQLITRDEFKIYMDGQTQTLNQIQQDVRAIRNR